MEKGIYGLIICGKAEVDQWNGIGTGWEQGALEHGKENMLKFKSNEVLKNQTSGEKREKPQNEKAAKTRVSQEAPGG